VTAAEELPGPDSSIAQWSDAIASGSSAPAGGSAAALAAALAAAVAALAGRVAAHLPEGEEHPEGAHIAERADRLRQQLLGMAGLDATAFAALRETIHLPEGAPTRQRRIASARIEAAQVQFDLLMVAERVVGLAVQLVEHGAALILADAGTAATLAAAACRSAWWNLQDDLSPINEDPAAAALLTSGKATLVKVEAMERSVVEEMRNRSM
jgi:formiminotetrahydrofolate cyclodeaminase